MNLDTSISFRFVRTTEQVADMLSKSAVTTTQGTSPMQLFDIHQPPKLNVDLQSLRTPLTRYLMSTILSATSKKGSWKEKLVQNPKLCGREFAEKYCSGGQRWKKGIDSMWKSFGKRGLFAATSLQKRTFIQIEMDKHPDVTSSSWRPSSEVL